jgi:pyruvate ferredoxin oxidoreductase beta subunit
MIKVRKAVAVDGPAFMNILAPCNRGWRTDTDDTLSSADLAVDTCFWPLFEVEYGEWKLSYRPKEKLPVIEWLTTEGRFRHLTNPALGFETMAQRVIDELQAEVDRRWEALLKRCGEA